MNFRQSLPEIRCLLVPRMNITAITGAEMTTDCRTVRAALRHSPARIATYSKSLSARAVLRRQLPRWLKVAAAAGMASSLVALLIAVYPVVDVVSRVAFAGKICAVVVVSNMAGVLIYRVGQARNTLE